MEVIQVAQYESETSDEEIIKENHDINEQRKKSKFWVKESTFDKPSETEDSSKTCYIPARDIQSITQANLNKYKNKKWSTFNQFQKSFDIW
ncbi:unnamed protein product, partial [Rotaria socialis]